MKKDLKHELYLACLAANDPTERRRATKRIKYLETLMKRRKEARE